jgi:hypothetical protein
VKSKIKMGVQIAEGEIKNIKLNFKKDISKITAHY